MKTALENLIFGGHNAGMETPRPYNRTKMDIILAFFINFTFHGLKTGLSLEEAETILPILKESKKWLYNDYDDSSYAIFYEESEISFYENKIQYIILSHNLINRKFKNPINIIKFLNDNKIEWTFIKKYTHVKKLCLLANEKIFVHIDLENKFEINKVLLSDDNFNDINFINYF